MIDLSRDSHNLLIAMVKRHRSEGRSHRDAALEVICEAGSAIGYIIGVVATSQLECERLKVRVGSIIESASVEGMILQEERWAEDSNAGEGG